MRRKFATGWFTGTATRAHQLRSDDDDVPPVMLWRATYPGGNCEDLTWHELRAALYAADQPAAGALAGGSKGASSCVPAAAPDGGHAAPGADVAPDAEDVRAAAAMGAAAVAQPTNSGAAEIPGSAAAPAPLLAGGEGGAAAAAAPHYKNIRYSTELKGYQAVVSVPQPSGHQPRARVTTGLFPTAEAAAHGADRVAREHGLLHKLNFPETAEERAACAAGKPAPPPPPAAASTAARSSGVLGKFTLCSMRCARNTLSAARAAASAVLCWCTHPPPLCSSVPGTRIDTQKKPAFWLLAVTPL